MRPAFLFFSVALGCADTTSDEGTTDTDASTDDTDTTATDDTDTTASGDTGTKPDPSCLITLDYTATIVTVASEPFGFDNSVRLAPVTGFFTFDRCTADTDVFESDDDGLFDHYRRETGAFSFRMEKGGGLTVTGSTRPVARIASLDYFYVSDGGEDIVDGKTIERRMSADGSGRLDIEMSLALGAGTVDFASDEIPEVFPMTGKSHADFDCTGSSYCVTFSVKDAKGTFLMQLDSLTQRTASTGN